MFQQDYWKEEAVSFIYFSSYSPVAGVLVQSSYLFINEDKIIRRF